MSLRALVCDIDNIGKDAAMESLEKERDKNNYNILNFKELWQKRNWTRLG